MPRVHIPARTPEPVWTVDRVGEAAAVLVLGAMIVLVGWASCWEVIQ